MGKITRSWNFYMNLFTITKYSRVKKMLLSFKIIPLGAVKKASAEDGTTGSSPDK